MSLQSFAAIFLALVACACTGKTPGDAGDADPQTDAPDDDVDAAADSVADAVTDVATVETVSKDADVVLDGACAKPTAFYKDADGDGFGDPAVSQLACVAPAGYIDDNTDCNDANSAINISLSEVCGNNVDDNCSGTTDEGCPDVCGNGICDGVESATGCPSDCGFLFRHLAGPCKTPGVTKGCEPGYVCVASGSGNVCVADFDTWPPLPDAHTASDFTEAGDFVTDNWTGLSWAKVPLPPISPWEAALPECATQTFGGFNDWRTPTRAEMLSLTDRTKQDPASSAPGMSWGPEPNQSFNDVAFYWTGTPYLIGGPAWMFDMQGGTATPLGDLNAFRVRCVRGGSKGGSGAGKRFVLHDAGATVLDHSSGLVWQKGVSAGLNHADAVAWCSANTVGSPGKGWRLPTSHELEGLADPQLNSPALDPIFAEGLNGVWAASLAVGGGAYWMVEFNWGDAGWVPDTPQSGNRARCVR